MVGSLKDAFETTNGATEVSKTAIAVKFFIGAMLVGLVVAAPLWYVFGVGFFKVMGVSLALATLSLFSLLDGGWFGSALYMMVLGLIVAVPVWLVFGTGFVTVLTVSVALGFLNPLLKGKEYREAARQRQQQAMLREPEHERPTREQEKSGYRPDPQGDGGGTRSDPTRPHELRAMPYKEYLQTPHWKRKREEKVRAAGRRCQLCNRGSVSLNVHHRTYERLGEELDEDLTVLCRDCHNTFHEHRRLGGHTREGKPADLEPRTVVPSAESAAQGVDAPTRSGMEKHTVSVGTDRYGETVTFTAKELGTAKVNGGSEGGGLDVTFYRLPDDTYRALGQSEGISLLGPSTFVEVFASDEPAEYGSWTFEEAEKDKIYGEFFTKFMAQHPEGRKRNVRDLD